MSYCITNITNNLGYFTEAIKTDINDNNECINIGVYFHICYNTTTEADIINNIKFTINSLNNDFNGKPINMKDSTLFINKLPNTLLCQQIRNIYNNSLKEIKPSNINFVAIGFSHIPIKEIQLITQYGRTKDELEIFFNKKAKPIEQNHVLNIWITMLDDTMGFAYHPWDNISINGIVIDYHIFDRNNLLPNYLFNKVITHQVGHWLGLSHINFTTNNNDNCVSDTMMTQMVNSRDVGNNYSNILLLYEKNTYCLAFNNFMNIADDTNMILFTPDQIKTMRTFIYKYKPELLIKQIDAKYDFTNNNTNIDQLFIPINKKQLTNINNSQHKSFVVPTQTPVDNNIVADKPKISVRPSISNNITTDKPKISIKIPKLINAHHGNQSTKVIQNIKINPFISNIVNVDYNNNTHEIILNTKNTSMVNNAPVQLVMYNKIRQHMMCTLNSQLITTINNTSLYRYATFYLAPYNINSYVGYYNTDTNNYYLGKVNKLSRKIIPFTIDIGNNINKLIIGTFGNRHDITYAAKIILSNNITDNIIQCKKYASIEMIK